MILKERYGSEEKRDAEHMLFRLEEIYHELERQHKLLASPELARQIENIVNVEAYLIKTKRDDK